MYMACIKIPALDCRACHQTSIYKQLSSSKLCFRAFKLFKVHL